MKEFPEWFKPYLRLTEPHRIPKEYDMPQDVSVYDFNTTISLEDFDALRKDATHLTVEIGGDGDNDIRLRFIKYVKKPNLGYSEKTEEIYKIRYEEYKRQSEQWPILKEQWDKEQERQIYERLKEKFDKEEKL